MNPLKEPLKILVKLQLLKKIKEKKRKKDFNSSAAYGERYCNSETLKYLR